MSDSIAPQTPVPAGSGRALDPVASLRRHWLLALGLAAAVAAAGVPLAWMKGTPTYYTEAAIRISPVFARNLGGRTFGEDKELELPAGIQYSQFVEQQARTVTRYEFVRGALDRLGAQRALWQADGETDQRAAERLMVALTVRAIPDTYLVTVGLAGRDPAHLATVVNAVVDEFVSRQQGEEFYGVDVRLKNLRAQRAQLLEDLGKKQRRQATLVEELGVTMFSRDSLNPQDQLLMRSQEALAEARRRRIAAESKLAALDAAITRERTIALDADAQDLMSRDQGLNATKSNLFLRRSQLLTERSALADAHPLKGAIERELEEIDAEVAQQTKATLDPLITMLKGQQQTRASQERSRVQAELEEAARVETQLGAEVAAGQARAIWYAERYGEGLTLRTEMDRIWSQLEFIDNRIDFLNLEAEAPGFARVVSPARSPQVPMSGGRKRLAIVMLIAAAVCGAVGAVGVDLLDPRVCGPTELERLLGFSLFGWLPQTGQPALELVRADRLRRLAMAVERERRHHRTRRIAVTAVRHGAGATGLALALARELSTLGVRTLVIEARGQRPDPRYAGEASPAAGTPALVDGAAASALVVPADDMFPDRVPLTHTAALGPLERPVGCAHLLDALGEVYDLILVDTPPIVATADTELWVQVTDATLLVVDARGPTRETVRQAARILERLRPPGVGAIMTRVPAKIAAREAAGVLRASGAPASRGFPAAMLERLWTS